VLFNLHITVILLAIGLVFLNDFIGLFWVLGLKRQFSEKFLRIEHRVISTAFLGAIGSGIAISIAKPEVFEHNGYWIKMAFVTMIGLNGFIMGRKCGKLGHQRFKTLPTRTKACISVCAVSSLFLWLSTALIGLTVMHSDF
jgi:uncharacterized membrane protein SirB2